MRTRFKKISINAQDMQLCKSWWVSYISILDPPSLPLISPPALSLPSQLCARIQGNPVDLRPLPLPPPRNHNKSSTVSAAHNAGLCSGVPCLHSGPEKHILLILRLKEKKKKFRNSAEGYTTRTWYRQDMSSDLPCRGTCFCSLHWAVLPLPSAHNILDRRLKLSQPNKRTMWSSPA